MAKKSFLSFLQDQLKTVPPVVDADLKDKTVVVVGANTGLGFEAAKHFARMGTGRLVLACRSQEKGLTAIKCLEEATGYSKAELWLVDLSEFASVRAFADKLIGELERLDILMLNAATTPKQDGRYTSTTDGWEATLQVNDLSQSLIALLVLPRLLETAKKFDTVPRIVVVASEVHFWTTIEDKVFQSPNAFELLGSEEYCTTRIVKNRYRDSKLLNMFFVHAFNNLLRNQPVIIDSVNPGFCYSELTRDVDSILLRLFQKLFARTAEEGSRQLIWAAIGDADTTDGKSLEKMRGAYVSLSEVAEPSDFVLGEEGKKREVKLWNDLIHVLAKIDPRVKDVESQHLAA